MLHAEHSCARKEAAFPRCSSPRHDRNIPACGVKYTVIRNIRCSCMRETIASVVCEGIREIQGDSSYCDGSCEILTRFTNKSLNHIPITSERDCPDVRCSRCYAPRNANLELEWFIKFSGILAKGRISLGCHWQHRLSPYVS